MTKFAVSKGDAMRFVVAAVIALGVALFCAKAVKNAPLVLYACAFIADIVYVYAISFGVSGGIWAVFLPLMQRCTLAMAFFAIVMFAGTLRNASSLKSKLMPIRRQLSITASILALCHVMFYANTYIMQIASIANGNTAQPALAANLFVSLAISLLITALLVVLTATSFIAIKSRMHATTWKRVQRFAYAFYALVFVHLAFILTPPALAGKEAATESMCVYVVVFAAYAILRIRRFVIDRNAMHRAA